MLISKVHVIKHLVSNKLITQSNDFINFHVHFDCSFFICLVFLGGGVFCFLDGLFS